MDHQRSEDIEAKIDELKRRFPKHSVPPAMVQELEDLEDELAELQRVEAESNDAG